MTTPELVQAQRTYFETGATRSAEFRLASLKKLQAAVQANERALAEAMAADFRKAPMEVYMCETPQYEAIERAIYGPYILPKEVVYFATKPTNSNVWGQIGGHIFCYGNDYIAAEK